MNLHKPAEMKRDRRSAHIGALACLPLFFPLEGRKALVVGGTNAAAWKAELLAAAGAEVHVYASDLSAAFEELLQNNSINGTIVRHARSWAAESFERASLAVADAACAAEAKAFASAARTAGVPVNVIDNPSYCDFQFGSIVNRSPVVIGISTNGSAPILGQAIRLRIETLLPRRLQSWAGLAGKLRGRVRDFLSSAQERRHFWERFADFAFSGKSVPEWEAEGLAELLLSEARGTTQGHVTLVGAGPGDADNITLKAARVLQSADIILFDDLVDDTILELARREAIRIPVGKQCGRGRHRQEDVTSMMASLVHQGKHVVRLKSGDPMSSGRGEEELDWLARQGISASVVPGLTSPTRQALLMAV